MKKNTEHKSNTPLNIRDLWQTPKPIFDHYNEIFNFTTDVASSSLNRFCQDHRSEKMDGLLTGWGDTNWCNPPYSDITPWVKKAIEQQKLGRQTAMLIPSDTSVGWFKLAFDNCTECHFVSGRISFINAETQKPVNGNNKGSVVFIFGSKNNTDKIVKLIDRGDLYGK